VAIMQYKFYLGAYLFNFNTCCSLFVRIRTDLSRSQVEERTKLRTAL